LTNITKYFRAKLTEQGCFLPDMPILAYARWKKVIDFSQILFYNQYEITMI